MPDRYEHKPCLPLPDETADRRGPETVGVLCPLFMDMPLGQLIKLPTGGETGNQQENHFEVQQDALPSLLIDAWNRRCTSAEISFLLINFPLFAH
jgi:hypothetical protein